MPDMIAQMMDRLREAGLAPERLEADGVLHRCGTTDKPRGMDGAYKAFLDDPATLWWKNWRTGEDGTWTIREAKDLTPAQRKALRERVAASRREAEAERAGRPPRRQRRRSFGATPIPPRQACRTCAAKAYPRLRRACPAPSC